MKIFKILNNNVAVVLDEHGAEKIVMGKGICFKKKTGEEICPEDVDKVFSLAEEEVSSKFQVLVQDILMEHMALGEEIITEAKMRLGKRLNDMVYISLIDHVHTSIVRFLEGVTVKNALLWDIRRFYKEEYQIGVWSLDLIEEKFKVRLPEDEAGFITHLKFFAKRLVERNIYTEDDNDDLWEVIRGKYPGTFGCVEKITQFIGKKYEYGLSKEEQLYLTIHVERVVNKTKQ